MASIQISNDPSGRLIVSFPYDPLFVAKVKTIEGRRWHPAEKQGEVTCDKIWQVEGFWPIIGIDETSSSIPPKLG